MALDLALLGLAVSSSVRSELFKLRSCRAGKILTVHSLSTEHPQPSERGADRQLVKDGTIIVAAGVGSVFLLLLSGGGGGRSERPLPGTVMVRYPVTLGTSLHVRGI